MGLGSITGYRISCLIVHAGRTFCCQNVVQRIMRIVSDRAIIIPCIKNISFGALCIVTCDQIFIYGNCDLLALSCCKLSCLSKTGQLNRRFFYKIFFVILRIGSLYIKLYHRPSCHVSGICHFYLRDNIRIRYLYIRQFLFKTCITQAVAKRILDFRRIVPRAVAFKCTFAAVRISLPENAVLISGLVIFISGIDTFLINHIVDQFRTIILCVLAGTDDLTLVGKGEISKILYCRRRQRVHCVCIHQLSGRIRYPCQKVDCPYRSFDTKRSDIQTGIHAVFFHPAKFQRVRTVVDQDYFFEDAIILVFLDHAEHIPLILVKGKLADAFIIGRLHIHAFPAFPGKDHHRNIPVIFKSGFQLICIERCRFFTNILRRSTGWRNSCCRAGFICLKQRIVNRKSGIFKCRIEIHLSGRIIISASAAACIKRLNTCMSE